MNELKHTPGPWVVKVGRRLAHIHGEDGRCLVVAGVGNIHNANLIAAAPDLLAGLERLDLSCAFDVLNPCWDNRPTDIPGQHWASGAEACIPCCARAAVAKAKGEV